MTETASWKPTRRVPDTERRRFLDDDKRLPGHGLRQCIERGGRAVEETESDAKGERRDKRRATTGGGEDTDPPAGHARGGESQERAALRTWSALRAKTASTASTLNATPRALMAPL